MTAARVLHSTGWTQHAGPASKRCPPSCLAPRCPPCRRFTPKLVEAVAKLREAGKEVLPVFVSGDRDVASFSEYHGHMTWPALHLEEQKQRIAELNM